MDNIELIKQIKLNKIEYILPSNWWFQITWNNELRDFINKQANEHNTIACYVLGHMYDY